MASSDTSHLAAFNDNTSDRDPPPAAPAAQLWTPEGGFDRRAIAAEARYLQTTDGCPSYNEALASAWEAARELRQVAERKRKVATTAQLRREVAEAFAEAKAAARGESREPAWDIEIQPVADAEGIETCCIVRLTTGNQVAAAAHCEPWYNPPGWRLADRDGLLSEERWLSPGRAFAEVAPELDARELDLVIGAHRRATMPPPPPKWPSVLPVKPAPRRAAACVASDTDPVIIEPEARAA